MSIGHPDGQGTAMYWFLRLLAALIGSLSDGIKDALAKAASWVLFDVVRLRRGLILSNLERAFPAYSAAERRRIGRASIYHFLLTIFEVFSSRKLGLSHTVTIRDRRSIDAALAQGRGAYIMVIHMGNHEAMGPACTHQVVPSHVLVKKVGSSGVERFVAELRDRNGFLTVKRQKKGDGMAAIADVLSRGEGVGFVMDQARPGEPKLPFFGHPAKTNTSLAAIWRRCPAPIVPAMIERTAFGQHIVDFFPALVLEQTDDLAADVIRHSTTFNAVVEQMVRRCPEQYFWLHNRWK